MANGIQSLRTVREDTDVRTKGGTDDSMMNYDIDMPSIAAIAEGLPFQGGPEINMPQTPPAPQMPPDAFSVDAFDPVDISMDAFDFSMDASDFEPLTIENKIENLNLDEGGIDPVSAFASIILGGDGERSLGGQIESSQQSELSEAEQKELDAVNAALLNNEMPLDFLDPAVQAHFAKFGIDLEQYMMDREARKEGGTPFINAGLALSKASQEGKNVPQAITSALATFSATKEKLNELDPMMLQIAMAMLPKPSGGATMKGFNAISGPLSLKNSGEFMGTDEQAVLYKSLYGDQSMVLSSQVSEEQKNRKDYYVPVMGDDGNISLDIQSLTENEALSKAAQAKGAGLFKDSDQSSLDLYQQSARTQQVSVFDNDLGTETIVTEEQVLEDEILASIDKSYKQKYRLVGGTKYPSQNIKTGETMDLSSESLNNKDLKEAGWQRITNQGSVVYGTDGKIIQSVGNVDGTLATKAIQDWKNEIVQRGEVANKMSTTLDQIDNTGMILSGGGDVSGGKFARGVFQFADLVVGGTKEVISAIGAEGIDVSFVVGGQTTTMENHRSDFLNKLNQNSSFAKMKSDILGNYSSSEARRQASNELEGAFYSMALQVAMGPYNMTARAISDKDMDRTLQLIGANAATFGSAMAVLTSELERSMITNNKNWAQSSLLTSLDSTTFVDDGAGGKTPLRQSILITDGQYIPDPNNPGKYILADKWTSDPNSGMGAINSLSDKITRMRSKYTSLSGNQTPNSTTVLYDPSVNIEKTINSLQSGRTYVTDNKGTQVQYQPAVLETRFTNNTAMIQPDTIGGQLLSELKTLDLGDEPPTLKQIIGIYRNVVSPKMTQDNAAELERAFYEAFGITTDEQKNLFRNYNNLMNRQGVQ